MPGIALDQPAMFETSGGGEEEVEEEVSSEEIESPVELHLSSLRSAAGVTGEVKVSFNPRFQWVGRPVGAGQGGGGAGPEVQCF